MHQRHQKIIATSPYKTPKNHFQSLVGEIMSVPSSPPLKNPNFFQSVVGTLDPDFGWYHFQNLVGDISRIWVVPFPEF